MELIKYSIIGLFLVGCSGVDTTPESDLQESQSGCKHLLDAGQEVVEDEDDGTELDSGTWVEETWELSCGEKPEEPYCSQEGDEEQACTSCESCLVWVEWAHCAINPSSPTLEEWLGYCYNPGWGAGPYCS